MKYKKIPPKKNTRKRYKSNDVVVAQGNVLNEHHDVNGGKPFFK